MGWKPVRVLVATLLAVVVGLGATAAPASAYTVYPGDSIHIQYSNGDRYSCSLNSVAYRGGTMYGITAGHCLEPIGGAVPVTIYAADDRTVIAGDLRDAGRDYWGDHTLAGALRDIAWFRMEGHVTDGRVLRGGHVEIPFIGAINGLSALAHAIYPDRRIAGRHGVNSVQPGQIVCKDGGRTSRTCGPVLHVNEDTGELVVLIVAIQGDSGSPVYTLNPDRSANIIGIASGTAFGVLLAVDQLGPLPAGLR